MRHLGPLWPDSNKSCPWLLAGKCYAKFFFVLKFLTKLCGVGGIGMTMPNPASYKIGWYFNEIILFSHAKFEITPAYIFWRITNCSEYCKRHAECRLRYIFPRQFLKIYISPLTPAHEKFADFCETSVACSSWYTELRTFEFLRYIYPF